MAFIWHQRGTNPLLIAMGGTLLQGELLTLKQTSAVYL